MKYTWNEIYHMISDHYKSRKCSNISSYNGGWRELNRRKQEQLVTRYIVLSIFIYSSLIYSPLARFSPGKYGLMNLIDPGNYRYFIVLYHTKCNMYCIALYCSLIYCIIMYIIDTSNILLMVMDFELGGGV